MPDQQVQLPDAAWLAVHDIGATDEERQQLATSLLVELEKRVGLAVWNELTEAQQEEFEELVKNTTDQQRIEWLEKALPSYPAITIKACEQLKTDITEADDPLAYIRSL